MDPTATYQALIDARMSGDHEAAAEHAANLLRWLNRGGFPPACKTAAEVRETCHAVCAAAVVAEDIKRAFIQGVTDGLEDGELESGVTWPDSELNEAYDYGVNAGQDFRDRARVAGNRPRR